MLGGYLHILGAPSVQSCCTLSISVSVADIANPDLFVGPGFVSTSRFYEELAQKTVIGPPLMEAGGVDTICTGFARPL